MRPGMVKFMMGLRIIVICMADTTDDNTDSENTKLRGLDTLATNIVKVRERPLFIMYYDDNLGSICETDIEEIYEEFRLQQLDGNNKLDHLDILLHTTGGDPSTPYLIVQTIRQFTHDFTVMVPLYAYSAGTLICLGSNDLEFGPYGRLSAIDISLGESGIQIISIYHFLNFAKKCRKEIEMVLNEINSKRDLKTNVDSELLAVMVQQVESLGIGSLERLSHLTEYYSKLLLNYMFEKKVKEGVLTPNARDELIGHIVNFLVFESPSHDFTIDLDIAVNLQMPVKRMSVRDFDLVLPLIKELQQETQNGNICHYLGKSASRPDGYRKPFFRLYKR